MQHPFVDEQGNEWARADFLVGRSLVVEFDGKKKYQADQADTVKEVEDIVWAEKQREDRIRRQRKVLVRLVWPELDRPRQVMNLVRQSLRDVEDLGYPL